MASSLFIDLQGQPIPDSQVLGYGRSGVVVYSETPSPVAIKIPLRHPSSSNADVQSNQRILRHEQEVFNVFVRWNRIKSMVLFLVWDYIQTRLTSPI